ncbi:ABC transporter substrate-binding protein [Bradyrhizobium sp. I1.7.5]|uniref:ABC transporter substrate-binding protein n=1 Tax=Bradyrhizobium sp. I1.7.5 TaxID=3156363 RepID=UPI003397970E
MTNRREFISLVASAAAYPVTVLADQNPPKPRVGVFTSNIETDPLAQARVGAFRSSLAALGWSEREVSFVVRWPGPDIARQERDARELVAMAPDVILTTSTSATLAVRDATSTIPVVFVGLADPLASGIVSNLARPDRNVTGFMLYTQSLSGKWLGLLKEIAPRTKDISILFNPDTAPYAPAYIQHAQEMSERLEVRVTTASVRQAADIAPTIQRIAGSGSGGVLVLPDGGFIASNIAAINAFTAECRVPTIYSVKSYVVNGGLMSYSADLTNQFREGARYVDRILRGIRPNDLPVQFATKFDLVINLRVADALGLTVPHSLLVDAELIE